MQWFLLIGSILKKAKLTFERYGVIFKYEELFKIELFLIIKPVDLSFSSKLGIART